MKQRSWVGGLGLAVAALLAPAHAAEPKRLVNLDGNGLALQGYDPVAYFAEGQAVRGDARISAVHEGATYRFASPEHRQRFEREPAAYAPAFGGYCAYAASIDKLAPIDPTVFQIHAGRLLLQYSRRTYEKFNAHLETSLAAADRHWPGLVAENGR